MKDQEEDHKKYTIEIEVKKLLDARSEGNFDTIEYYADIIIKKLNCGTTDIDDLVNYLNYVHGAVNAEKLADWIRAREIYHF